MAALWRNDVWHESVYETKVSCWIPPCRKKWHPLTFIIICWNLMEITQWMWAQWGGGWCISAVVTATSKTSQVLDGHADFCDCGMPALVHRWQKCIADGDDCWKRVFCSWEFVLSNSVIVLFVSVVVSMEVNRGITFRATNVQLHELYTCYSSTDAFISVRLSGLELCMN